MAGAISFHLQFSYKVSFLKNLGFEKWLNLKKNIY